MPGLTDDGTCAGERTRATVFPNGDSADEIARDVVGVVTPEPDYAVGEAVIETGAVARDRFPVDGAVAD